MLRRVTIAVVMALGWVAPAWAGCGAEASEAEQAACLAQDLRDSDKRINAVYKALMGNLDEAGQKTLRDEQRAWLKPRDKACALDTKESDREKWLQGILADQGRTLCVVRYTFSRVTELDTQLQAKAATPPADLPPAPSAPVVAKATGGASVVPAASRLVDDGWQPVGFDHFAQARDDLAAAARRGALRRNFQGFTDDPAEVLIGLGVSAISMFPGAVIQNEKNAGRYHLRSANGKLAAARGIRRGATDRWRGAAIEQLLCRGGADLAALPALATVRARLEPFAARGLIGWSDARVTLLEGATPYARAIAATIDPYRQHSATRFSSAV